MATQSSTLSRFEAPSLSLLVTEPWRAVLDFASGRFGQPEAVAGDGHPVVVYPGLGAGPITTRVLRKHLEACQFSVHDWEAGVNKGPDGPFDAWLDGLAGKVRSLHQATGRQVSLVGWSLGGVYAREISRLAPHAVRQVVTLGTPFASMGGASHAGTLFRLLGGDTSHLTPELELRLRQPPPVPSTSVYSRTDGLVSWRGCLQEQGPKAENVAVQASHLGMATHPEVLRVVADRLAQAEGQWRRYRPRRAV